MKTFAFVLAGIVAVAAFPLPAHASSIGHVTQDQATCHSVTMGIHLDSGWEAAPKSGKVTYKVSERQGAKMTEDVATSNDDVIEIKGLQEWTPYDFVVEARARPTNRPGLALYRFVGELKLVTSHCNTIGPNSPLPGDVRLRHEATGKCIFAEPIDGRPVKTFTCWNDPEMVVGLEKLGGNLVRIRMRAKGKCLYGDPNNGGFVKAFTCWEDPHMVFVMEELGNNRVRFKQQMTGQCMFGDHGEAKPVRNWACWDDPNMVWVRDPI